MDRQVEIKVKYGTATADSKFIGVVGDALVTTLRVTFSPDWEGYAKTLFMWDARGQNPVALLLGPDLLEDVLVAGVYLVKIPASPLSLAGDGVAIVFEGVKEQGGEVVVQRTENLYFTVLEANEALGADAPADVTPTLAAQLQGQIEAILPSLQADVEAAQAARAASEEAESTARASAASAQSHSTYAGAARLSAEAAKDGAAAYCGLTNIAKDAALAAKDGAVAAQAAAILAKEGAQGARAAIEAMTASVAALDEGASPTVTKTTAEGVVNLAFGIPKGDKGDRGDTGPTGPQGHSVAQVYKKSGDGTAGTTDVYGVKINDAGETEVGAFTVYNGADGEGTGDMLRSAYDGDGDGKVNAADNTDKLGGQLPAYYAADAALTAHIGNKSNPHAVTAAQAGAIPSNAKGTVGGVAELDGGGKVPSSQLPSYVDDVLEYVSAAAFPAQGEAGKIYVAQDANKTYRWSGSTYVEIAQGVALGETSATAYRGDRGKAAYDHSRLTSGNPHGVTLSDVGGAAANHTHTGMIPSGCIVLWSGAASAIPSGWALCNGLGGTPDLRDRFVVGAGSAYAVGDTGGAASVTLDTTQIPSHTHANTIADGGEHTHTISFKREGSNAGDYIGLYSYSTTAKIVTTNTTGSSHSHTLTNASAGGGTSHENRPPYFALCYIMKL